MRLAFKPMRHNYANGVRFLPVLFVVLSIIGMPLLTHALTYTFQGESTLSQGSFLGTQTDGSGTVEIAATTTQAAWLNGDTAVAQDYGTGNYTDLTTDPSMLPDGSGGFFLAWDSTRDAGFRTGSTYIPCVFVQHVDASGNALWTKNGVGVTGPGVCTLGGQDSPGLVSDGAGGFIVTWRDGTTGNGLLSTDIYAQHFDSSGNRLWGDTAAGVATSTNFDYQDPAITTDGSGGAFIAWNVSGGIDEAQRIDSSGTVMWTSPVKLHTTTTGDFDPEIVSDGAGGFIATWSRTGNKYVYAQRIDGNGNLLWSPASSGVWVATGSLGVDQVTMADGAGGAIIAFHSVNGMGAQHIDSTGTTAWTATTTSMVVASSTTISPGKLPLLLSDGSGGSYVTWLDSRSGNTDIYTQHLDSTGSTTWAFNGVGVAANSNAVGSMTGTADGSGGLYVVWQDETGFGYTGTNLIRVQHLDSGGNLLLDPNGLQVSNAFRWQTSPVAVSDGAGGVLTAWSDNRHDPGFNGFQDVYAQRILATPQTRTAYPDGYYGGIATSSTAIDWSTFSLDSLSTLAAGQSIAFKTRLLWTDEFDDGNTSNLVFQGGDDASTTESGSILTINNFSGGKGYYDFSIDSGLGTDYFPDGTTVRARVRFNGSDLSYVDVEQTGDFAGGEYAELTTPGEWQTLEFTLGGDGFGSSMDQVYFDVAATGAEFTAGDSFQVDWVQIEPPLDFNDWNDLSSGAIQTGSGYALQWRALLSSTDHLSTPALTCVVLTNDGSACGAGGGDTTPPTAGTVVLSATTSSSLTGTVSGASDAGGLAALPYIWHETSTDTYTAATSSTAWTLTGLTPNTQYTIEVGVTDGAGNAATSTATSGYTLAETPSAAAATADSDSQITVTWSAGSNPSGTEYRVTNETTGQVGSWVTSTSAVETGLSASTAYTFGVIARNHDGIETATSTASATTHAAPSSNNGNKGAGGNGAPVGLIGPGTLKHIVGTDPGASIVIGPSKTTMGDIVFLSIDAKNPFGTDMGIGGDAVAVTVSGANSAYPAVTDNHDGTYTARYLAANSGEDTIVATINGQRVAHDSDGTDDGVLHIGVGEQPETHPQPLTSQKPATPPGQAKKETPIAPAPTSTATTTPNIPSDLTLESGLTTSCDRAFTWNQNDKTAVYRTIGEGKTSRVATVNRRTPWYIDHDPIPAGESVIYRFDFASYPTKTVTFTAEDLAACSAGQPIPATSPTTASTTPGSPAESTSTTTSIATATTTVTGTATSTATSSSAAVTIPAPTTTPSSFGAQSTSSNSSSYTAAGTGSGTYETADVDNDGNEEELIDGVYEDPDGSSVPVATVKDGILIDTSGTGEPDTYWRPGVGTSPVVTAGDRLYITDHSLTPVTEYDAYTTGKYVVELHPLASGNVALVADTISLEQLSEAFHFPNPPIAPSARHTLEALGLIGGALLVLPAASGVPFSMGGIGRILLGGWTSFFGFLALRKRRRAWGTVYDSVTKAPLDPAIVEIFDAAGKEAGQAITDLDGRYGFLVPAGTYTLRAAKTNYIFPSRLLAGKTSDVLYDRPYFGEAFEVSDNEAIAKNVPLDPIDSDWNQVEKLAHHRTRFSKYDPYILMLLDGLFFLGILLVFWQLFAHFSPSAAFLAFIYIILLALRLYHGRPRLYGVITKGGRALSFGIVRFLRNGSEVLSRVIDVHGRYIAILPPATYEMVVQARTGEETYTPVYQTEIEVGKSGVVNREIAL